MKKTKRLWALLLAMVMALGLISTAFAAPTIDSGRKASLSLYKYDITAASEDGAWNTASYVSTGVQDDAVTDKLAQYAILHRSFQRPSTLPFPCPVRAFPILRRISRSYSEVGSVGVGSLGSEGLGSVGSVTTGSLSSVGVGSVGWRPAP